MNYIYTLYDMKYIIVAALTFFFYPVFGQNNCDCIEALEINKNKTEQMGNKGVGKSMEIFDADPKSLYRFEKEHNISWFRFETKTSSDLTFEIIPDNINDDVDFILLKYDEEGFCDRIKSKKMLPARTNLARSGAKNNGITGLTVAGTEEFVPSGPGNQYSKSIHVQQGEVFYLAVDNVSSEGKFSIHINVNEEKNSEEQNQPAIASKDETAIKTPFTLRVTDDATNAPVKANIDIAGYSIGEPFHASDTSVCSVFFLSSQTITINCNAAGYVFYTKKMFAPSIPYDAKENPPNVDFEIRLKKIKVGEHVRLPNIKFKGDETEILPISRPALFSLLRFMESNPKVKIEIGGHVNAPDMRNSAKLKKLSKDRAKAVSDYLTEKGIEPSRVEYKGYGNSKMIYKAPLNEMQNEENRRVEVQIVSD